MPTIRPHEAREVAESFGTDAARYDRTRPRYPSALIERIAAPDVLDVGCGTGIAARQLQAAGCTVLGVEPDARMADFARRSGVDIEVSTFETWDPAGRTFSAVVSGTAWHWIDPVLGAAKAATALRPGGLLAVFWNIASPPPEVADAFATTYHRLVPDSPVDLKPGGYQALHTKAADGILAVDAFTSPEQWQFDWSHPCTRAEWLDQLPTTGILIRLPRPVLSEILDAVGSAIDTLGGTFTLRYNTIAITATRTQPTPDGRVAPSNT